MPQANCVKLFLISWVELYHRDDKYSTAFLINICMSAAEKILSVLITITLGIASFSLVWMFNSNAKMAVIEHNLTQMMQDTDDEQRQNRTLGNHWKLHGWTKDQINDLRYAAGKEAVTWPDLD